MPTVLRSAGYRFFFYSSDRGEPAHVHVERGDGTAKFWLAPVGLQFSAGFGRVECHRIRALVEWHADELLRAWHDFFAE